MDEEHNRQFKRVRNIANKAYIYQIVAQDKHGLQAVGWRQIVTRNPDGKLNIEIKTENPEVTLTLEFHGDAETPNISSVLRFLADVVEMEIDDWQNLSSSD